MPINENPDNTEGADDGSVRNELGILLDAQMETRPSGSGLSLHITDPASGATVNVFLPETPEGAAAVMLISDKMFELVGYALEQLSDSGEDAEK